MGETDLGLGALSGEDADESVPQPLLERLRLADVLRSGQIVDLCLHASRDDEGEDPLCVAQLATAQ